MRKVTSRKRHKIKPVHKLINYCTNILDLLASGKSKSENQIYEELRKVNKKGLNFKRDAIDTIRILERNHIIKISANHSQRYELELDQLGRNLVSLKKNMGQSIKLYDELKSTIENNFIYENVTQNELKARLLARGWKLEEVHHHNEWLREGTRFIIETSFAATLALSSSYVKLAYHVKDNDAAKVILNDIFSSTLKQGFSLPSIINGQEILMNNVIAQFNDPILQYIIDNLQDRNLAENKFIREKINGVINSIYSVVEPGKNVNNFHDLLGFILSVKKSNVFPTRSRYIPPST